MVTTVELPDWLRGTLLLGRASDGSVVPVLIDAAGQINILVRGVDPVGTIRTIAVDDAGQLYAILRGADDVDVAVDAAGNLAAILKGLGADAALHTVAVDNSGRIVMVPYGTTTVAGTATVTQAEKDREVQGADGATLRTLAVDASGQLIMVPRGQSGNYMSVDASGFLTAVLKGIQDGVLTTIAVDASGRIDAFILDSEDQWGKTLRVGNSELAGRLGSPVSWDWRGSAILVNTFGLGQGAIFHYHSGTGSSVAVDPTTFLTDGYSLLCLGGDAAAYYAGYDGRLGVNPSDRFGFALAWAPSGDFGYILVALYINVGGTAYVGRIKWTRSTYALEYLDSAGAYQSLGQASSAVGSYAFNRVKLVVNITTAMYTRLLWNNTEYNLSAYALRAVAGLAQGTLEYQFRVYPDAAPQTGVYVDHHIITVNEPA